MDLNFIVIKRINTPEVAPNSRTIIHWTEVSTPERKKKEENRRQRPTKAASFCYLPQLTNETRRNLYPQNIKAIILIAYIAFTWYPFFCMLADNERRKRGTRSTNPLENPPFSHIYLIHGQKSTEKTMSTCLAYNCVLNIRSTAIHTPHSITCNVHDNSPFQGGKRILRIIWTSKKMGYKIRRTHTSI